MSLSAKKINLDEFKKIYVKKKIDDKNYEILPSNFAIGNVFKIKCYGSLNIDGYEHGFLYIPEGSSVRLHSHTNNIELYNVISGDKKIDSNICLLGAKHGIDVVECDTLIETFKVSKDIIKDIDDITKLNESLLVQLNRYMWQLNEVLNKLAMDEEDIGWRPLDHISYIYDISEDSLRCMEEVYFKDKSNIPYESLSIEELKKEIKWETIPYVVEDFYKYQLDNNIEISSTKQLVKG